MTASEALFGDGAAIARAIKKEILEQESLTASVGVASSKFLAKLASDLRKPDGLVQVRPGSERRFLAPLEIERLWGAGPKTLERLHRLAIRTFGDMERLALDAWWSARSCGYASRWRRRSAGRILRGLP